MRFKGQRFRKKWSNKRNKIDEHEDMLTSGMMTSQLSENEQSAKFG